MKLLTENLTSAYEKLKHDNPPRRFVLLPTGVWFQRSDRNWQAAIQQGNNPDIFYIMEKGDIQIWMDDETFRKGMLPSAMASDGVF